MILQLCAYMPVHTVCDIIGEDRNKVWCMLKKTIYLARQLKDFFIDCISKYAKV